MTITVTLTDVDAGADAQAALYIVNQENARREAEATPEDPAELLPTSPQSALKASYETVLAATLQSAHVTYQSQAAAAQAETQNVKELWRDASVAQRAAAVEALQS